MNWEEVPNVIWNQGDWDDAVTQTEVCVTGLDCPCGEYIDIYSVNSNVNCRECGRQYRVVIERKVVCYTPLAIRYPKHETEEV